MEIQLQLELRRWLTLTSDDVGLRIGSNLNQLTKLNLNPTARQTLTITITKQIQITIMVMTMIMIRFRIRKMINS